MIIRQEKGADHTKVFDLIKNAFQTEEQSGHREQFLVKRLRHSNSFIPELSLVAEIDKKIVSFILLTKIKIVNNHKEEFPSLALAHLAVLRSHQKKGIGEHLIRSAHKKATELEFGSVILLGHENYYPRFGYQMTSKYSIILPFDVPDENCMLIELAEGALKNINEIVEYPQEFYL